jgi:predicted transcriptional regulator
MKSLGTNKQLVRQALRDSPEEASIDDIVERIQILASIREGLADIEAGRFITNEEMKRLTAQWVRAAKNRETMTNKQLVLKTVKQLPDDVSMEEIEEQIAILASIRRGEEAADAGDLVPHEEVKRLVAKWLSE